MRDGVSGGQEWVTLAPPDEVTSLLCAVDFSNATRATVGRAVDLARRHGLDRIHLIHVAEIVRRDVDDGEARSLDDWIAQEEGAAAEIRRFADAVAREVALAVVPEFRTGIAWREIVECARSLRTDLLVVGAGGRTRSDTDPSIVEQLVREAPCTTVVVQAVTP